MIGMTSHKFPMVRNTFYYSVQVIRCVRRSRGYCKSSKTTKYALRAVACVSPRLSLPLLSHSLMSRLIYSDSLQANEELCNFFAAINLGDCPQDPSSTTSADNAPGPAAPRSSGPVVDNNNGRNIVLIQQFCRNPQQGGTLASPAKEPCPLVHEQSINNC
jgi:hypothetical protein